jgi:hypothetical protein
MSRTMLKVLLAVSLVAGSAVLLVGHQLYMVQKVTRGESSREPLIVPALVPRFEAVLGKETMLAPQTLTLAWALGGILAGVGFLGLLVIAWQDSSRARKAARLIPEPTFDERDRVSSHHFVEEGLEGRARMIRVFSFVAFLPVLFAPIGIAAAVTHRQWITALIVFAAAAAFGAMGVYLWRGDKGRFRKNGVERIDIMTGGLRWVRHGDPAVRSVAWSQIAGSQTYGPYSGGGHPWNHCTTLTLRTGEKICLPKCCLTDYDACVDLVERGRKDGNLSAKYSGDAGLAMALRRSR